MFCIGPLNLNERNKLATTVQNKELPLDEYEFDALYMLATREGEAIAFEHLYTEVWLSADCHCTRQTAREALTGLLAKVNYYGNGFMWIDHCHEKGYTFRTKWANGLTENHERVKVRREKR